MKRAHRMLHEILHSSALDWVGIFELFSRGDIDELLKSGFGQLDLSKEIGFGSHCVDSTCWRCNRIGVHKIKRDVGGSKRFTGRPLN